jgi:hypothetical protein
VREEGPDVLVVGRGTLAQAMSNRLHALGVTFRQEEVAGHVLFHGLSRRVDLESLAGYEDGLPPPLSGDSPEGPVGDESDTTS